MTNIDWTTWHVISQLDARFVLKTIWNREPLPMQRSEREISTWELEETTFTEVQPDKEGYEFLTNFINIFKMCRNSYNMKWNHQTVTLNFFRIWSPHLAFHYNGLLDYKSQEALADRNLVWLLLGRLSQQLTKTDVVAWSQLSDWTQATWWDWRS